MNAYERGEKLADFLTKKFNIRSGSHETLNAMRLDALERFVQDVRNKGDQAAIDHATRILERLEALGDNGSPIDDVHHAQADMSRAVLEYFKV